MVGQRRTWRRVVLLGVPSLYVLLGLLHPTANPELGDETDLFIGLHIAQLFLIMGLGYVLWLLVEGVTNRAATLARALIIPFLVVYTALDAILGIAWGIAAEVANGLPVADQPGAGRLIDELISGDPDPRGLILYWGAGLLWVAVALSVVAALRDTAPLGALVSMALGAAVFTLGHAPPMGPVGMGLFLIGIAWAEFRTRSCREDVPTDRNLTPGSVASARGRRAPRRTAHSRSAAGRTPGRTTGLRHRGRGSALVEVELEEVPGQHAHRDDVDERRSVADAFACRGGHATGRRGSTTSGA